MVRTELQHPSHPHLLNWTTRIETSYQCDGCKEEGLQPCYQCNENGCHYHLHEHCSVVDLDHNLTTHEKFFSNTGFQFFNRSLLQVRLCVACGKRVQGFRYQSITNDNSNDKLVIHPCCFKLQTVLHRDLHQVHDQVPVNLTLFNRIKKHWFIKCLRCHRRKISENIDGWVYVSDSRDICYHVSCIQDWILDKWKKDQLQYNPNGDLARQISQMANEHNLPEKKVCKIGRMVVKVALHLIISAVLGEAIGGNIDLVF